MTTQANKSYIKYSWFLLGAVFLVILAGGVVRMTQSGMGCPDWPKCFGLWIPPTDASQLPTDFERYLDKQDIDHTFNVYHTWIEYINRLLGALLGLFIIYYVALTSYKFSVDKKQIIKNITFVFACIPLVILVYILFKKWVFGALVLLLGALINYVYKSFKLSTKKGLLFVAYLLLIAVAIQGYLGKVVVDENLSVVKITIHMIGALVIAALPLINIVRINGRDIKVSPFIKHIVSGMVVILLLQIILGTQVREEIDTISKALSYENRELWIGRLSSIFLIHRSFSWLILIGSLFMMYRSSDFLTYKRSAMVTVFLVLSIIVLGIVMTYLDMPAIAQPLHLLLACALLMQLFYVRLRLES